MWYATSNPDKGGSIEPPSFDLFLLCRRSAGQLSVPLGFFVVSEVVMDPRA